MHEVNIEVNARIFPQIFISSLKLIKLIRDFKRFLQIDKTSKALCLLE